MVFTKSRKSLRHFSRETMFRLLLSYIQDSLRNCWSKSIGDKDNFVKSMPKQNYEAKWKEARIKHCFLSDYISYRTWELFFFFCYREVITISDFEDVVGTHAYVAKHKRYAIGFCQLSLTKGHDSLISNLNNVCT